jgi:hypothetical protein
MEEMPEIIRLSLRYYEAMLTHDLDDEKRQRIQGLIKEAKEQLAALIKLSGQKRAQNRQT